MLHKTVDTEIQLKATSDETGAFSAVFATLNVIDKDGDVTVDGAFMEGQEVLVSAYQHKSWEGALPVGTGKIRTQGNEAIVDGQFFMDTTEGLNTYRTAKHLKGRMQWSYGYDVMESDPGTFEGQEVQFLKSLFTHEVSPVLIGAGVNTRTLDVKSRKDGVMAPQDTYAAAIRPHDSRVNTKRWDGKAARSGLPEGMTIDDLRAVHAFVKADGNPTDIKSYGFLHHDTVGGEANLRACLSGIAEINGTKCDGMTPVERKAVYDHLAGHMEDGDLDAPEFKANPGADLKFYEEAADVLMRLDRLAERTAEVMAIRRAKGKAIAAPTVLILEWVYDGSRKLRSELDSPQEDADREYARFIRSQLTGETP